MMMQARWVLSYLSGQRIVMWRGGCQLVVGGAKANGVGHVGSRHL